MTKINRLKIALKTGAFWSMFKPAPVAVDFTPNRGCKEEKYQNLWDKYQVLLKRYGDNNSRFMALYEAHRRDLMRLINRYETS